MLSCWVSLFCQSVQVKLFCYAPDPVQFVTRRPPIKLRIRAGMEAWAVLVHQVDISVARYLVGEKGQGLFAAGEIIRQHEMSDDQATLGNAGFAQDQIADLAMHFHNGSPVDFGIVVDAKERLG